MQNTDIINMYFIIVVLIPSTLVNVYSKRLEVYLKPDMLICHQTHSYCR